MEREWWNIVKIFEQVDLYHISETEFVPISHCFAEPSLKYFLKDMSTVEFNTFS